MRSSLADTLEILTGRCLSDIQSAENFDQLKKILINIEKMLGKLEQSYDEDPDELDEFINALEEVWGDVCGEAFKIYADPEVRDIDAIRSRSPEEFVKALQENNLEVAFDAVIAANLDESFKKQPLLAAAAKAKHASKGDNDEIACLRLLILAGFDPDVPDDDGCTALHYMVMMKEQPFSHPRAVRCLLDIEIDPNMQNARGETAFCCLTRKTQWTDEMVMSAAKLLEHGANPIIPADDGSNAYEFFQQNPSAHDEVPGLLSFINERIERGRAAR